MGIQKDVEAVSFSGGNEVQRESFASKIMNVKIGVIPFTVICSIGCYYLWGICI